MKSRQYTIRSVPERVDRELRKRAKAEGKSLNTVIVELLEQAVAPSGQPRRNRNLERFAGTWVEDPEFDEAMKYFDRIDEEMWK
jgi:plasmid stability protein